MVTLAPVDTMTLSDVSEGAAEESAELRKLAAEAAAAAKEFEEASSMASELALMNPKELKAQYEADWDKAFADLAKAKVEAVNEVKEYLAKNL